MGTETQKNILVIFFLILTSHSQQHVDVQVIFERCYQNSKWPSEVNFKIFCAGDLLKVLLKLKMAATDQYQFF